MVDTTDIPEAGEEWFRKARLVVPQPSEVENARAYLLKCQKKLGVSREAAAWGGFDKIKNMPRPSPVDRDEQAVLAALSWGWDAQERAGLNRGPRAWIPDWVAVKKAGDA